MALSKTIVTVVITLAVAVTGASAWMIFSRMQAEPAAEAAAPAPDTAPAAPAAAPLDQERQRLARERDEALAQAERARRELAAARAAPRISSLAGEWSGTVPVRGPGRFSWVFHRNGTFTESDGDTGEWTQDGASIQWFYNHDGIVYSGRIDGDVATGTRYVGGEATGSFTLRRVTR